jgi:DNA-binding MarR family transcriptional regulator
LKLKLQVVNLNKLKRQLIPTDKPARWLNNHEWSAWLQLLATLTLLPATIDSHLQREAGLSHFEFGVMAALSRQPGRSLQLKDLAVVANGSLSRLSHVIARLEQQGWVLRVSGAKGRATNAELTAQGYRKLMEAGPIHFAEVRRLVFDVLTPEEVDDLRRLTSRINAGLIPETNLGPLARRTRARAMRQSS